MSGAPEDTRSFSSWKEIASHLGIGVRTAQIWERDRALPVRRLPGPRGRVYATAADLAAWKASRDNSLPVDEAGSDSLLWRRWAVASILLIVITAGGFALATRRSGLASVSVAPDALQGLDRDGAVLWQHHFGILNQQAYADGGRRSWVGNLSGRPSVLFVPVPANIVSNPVPLVCLDTAGHELWRFVPGQTVRHNGEEFSPPFVVRQFAVIGDKIVVTSHHHLYYPAQVAVLDARGTLVRQYWHPGHLNSLAAGTYQGRQVAFLGGVNNLRHQATMVVLDPERWDGAAREAGRPFFDNMAAPVEIARLLFPRSGINPADPYNVVVNLLAQPDRLIVDVHERLTGDNLPSIQYHFNGQLELLEVVPSDVFLSEYRQQTKHQFTPADDKALHRLAQVY